MNAIICHRYGSPDVLQLEEIPKPTPQDGEVLVKVHAVSLNAADWHILKADPFLVRLSFGLLKPKYEILGADIAGRVEAVGRNAREFQPGDDVFGDISACGWGGLAEYVCVREDALVLKPAGTTFEEAAAVPLAAVAALQGLRDHGQIQPGQKVLINGASGGVGTFAVQIAKSFGAEVSGVCSTSKINMVRSIGADHVIDYMREDFTRTGQRYDLILDAAAHRSILDYRRALSPKGVYVMVGGTRMFQAVLLGPLLSMVGGKKMGSMLAKPDKRDLLFVRGLLESGQVVPVVDRRYALGEVPAALRYLAEGHARGKVVVTV